MAQSTVVTRGILSKKRSEIPPLPTKDVIPPAESDDEDNHRDFNFRRRPFLKKARREASEKRAKERASALSVWK